jgi:SMODS-associating 2TM, beta-strand rich effector domain
MPTRNWTRIAIALAAAIASGVVWLTTGDVDFNYAKWTVSASTVVIIGLLLFDSVLWRYRPFRWLVRRPILHGTWKMEQRTSYELRKDETMESYLVVHQTFSSIRVDGLYPISDSECLTANLSVDEHRCTLSFLFRSEAHTMNREGNPPSRGAAVLKVGRRPHLHLEGDYWMERGTRGRIRSVGYTSKLYTTFDAAQDGSYSANGGASPSSARSPDA